MTTSTEYMESAVALALKGMRKGAGGPFAALIVQNGKIVGKAHNETFLNTDPTAHAEVQAIRDACKKLKTLELAGCDMYTTGEPCPMCMGAIYWSMIDNVYFANTKEEAALCGFDDRKIYKELSLPWQSRTLNMVHMPVQSAAASFEEWRVRMQGEVEKQLNGV